MCYIFSDKPEMIDFVWTLVVATFFSSYKLVALSIFHFLELFKQTNFILWGVLQISSYFQFRLKPLASVLCCIG